MIVTADWVLSVAGPAIRGGAVLTDADGRIEQVAPLDQVVASHPDDVVERFDGCAIIPGLVNAHTHVSLTVLSGLVPRMPMRPFLSHVTAAIQAMSHGDFAASAALGALESLRGGVTCVGDIAYGPASLTACAGLGLAGVFYFEVLGIEHGGLRAQLERHCFPLARGACAHGRARCGISPHAPYSVGPEPLQAAVEVARETGASLAVHVAESVAERELMLGRGGPLLEVSARLAHGFEAPGVGSVAYLARLGVLQDIVAIHCANLEPGDPNLLATARGVVLCPRSNVYLQNGTPPVAALREAGVRLAIGTDSPASNTDLDLFEEARALLALDRDLTPQRVLEMVTRDGARALALDDRLGALAPGLDADLTVVRIGETADPVAAVVATGGCETVQAVMTAGRWRIRDGRPVGDVSVIETRAAAARDVAARAIAAGP